MTIFYIVNGVTVSNMSCTVEDEALSLLLPPWRKGIDDLVGGSVLLHPLFMLDPSSSDPENKMTISKWLLF